MATGFLEDKGAENKTSATRLALLVWLGGVIAVWIAASIKLMIDAKTGALAEIPWSVITLTGILAGGKSIQRFGEKK